MSPDYEVQADCMEKIAYIAKNTPQNASVFADNRVLEALVNIIDTDNSKLVGPSSQQVKIREKILAGKNVSESEKVLANEITPKEQVERNKQYAIYTLAFLQKMYGENISKQGGVTVPFAELPMSNDVVEQAKSNPNPMVRVAAIEALSFIQKPEYKNDISSVLDGAKADKSSLVQKATNKAILKLDMLNQNK